MEMAESSLWGWGSPGCHKGVHRARRIKEEPLTLALPRAQPLVKKVQVCRARCACLPAGEVAEQQAAGGLVSLPLVTGLRGGGKGRTE